MALFKIEQRRQVLVNTDPQRRCYNGCHFSSEWVWTSWDFLQVDIPEEKVEERLAWWRDLNDYAVRERGKGAKREFRAVLQEEVENVSEL